MSIVEVTYYQGMCDWPGCKNNPHEQSDFSAWDDKQGVIEDFTYAEWLTTGDGQHHYCPKHPTVHASDRVEFKDSVKFPDPPYLLINDLEDLHSVLFVDSEDGLFEEPTRVPLHKGDRVKLLTMWGDETCEVVKVSPSKDGYPMVTVTTESGDTITVNRSSLKEISA